MLNYLVHLAQTESIESSLLIDRSTDSTSNLLYFNSCHFCFSLSFKYTFNTDTSVLSYGSCISQLLQSHDSSLYEVVRVRRALRLSQNVSDTNTLKYSTHSTTGYHSSTVRSRLHEHLSTAEAYLNLMRDSTLQHGNTYEVLLCSFYTLGNSSSYLTGLTKAPTDNTVLITYYNDCSECESASTFCYLGNTVDSNESIFQLDVVSYLNSIYCHDD